MKVSTNQANFVREQITALQDAKSQMQEAKSQIRGQIKREYLARADRIIAERIEEIERAFARKLRDAAEAGIPQGVLRQKVLRTNTWSIWTKWRDLAGIEPVNQKSGEEWF